MTHLRITYRYGNAVEPMLSSFKGLGKLGTLGSGVGEVGVSGYSMRRADGGLFV